MEHWQHHHPTKLVEIKQWLGEEDYKLRSYEKLAQEGMEGTGGPRNKADESRASRHEAPIAIGDPRNGNSWK